MTSGWDWSPHVHWEVLVLCITMIVVYERAAAVRAARTGEEAVTTGQRWRWILGTATIFFSAQWPIHDLAEGSLYSAHMVQHMLITLVAPPLLLTGTPGWMARALLPGPVMRVVRFVTRPLIALVTFNTVLVFTHWPLVVNGSVGDELVHFSLHVLIFASALAMWMPVLSPLVELPRLSYPKSMFYLFLQSIVPTVPASFLTFGSRPLYAIYEAMPKAWGMSPLTDQRAAGLIMKIAGGFIIWGVIGVFFFKWAALERESGIDALGYDDVERSLRAELTKR